MVTVRLTASELFFNISKSVLLGEVPPKRAMMIKTRIMDVQTRRTKTTPSSLACLFAIMMLQLQSKEAN